MAHPFLSDDWFAAVEALHDEAPEPPAAMKDLTLNVVVQGGPGGDREVNLTGGHFERGLVDGAPTTLTVPFEIAKALFVDGNPQAAMQAFMSGKIKVEGDMSKLMAVQSAGMTALTPEQKVFQDKLQAITA